LTNANLDNLNELYGLHLHPFPRRSLFQHSSIATDGATLEKMNDLHADLVLYDGDVSGWMSQVIKGSQKPKHHYARAKRLAAKIREMIKRYPDSELLRAYLKEYDELQRMLDVAEKMARE